MQLNWNGPKVREQIAQRLAKALTEIDLRIETEAKAELYPGHGKVSGNLQRAIQGETARVEARRIRGRVGVKGVPYALKVHKRYEYLVKGFKRVQPKALDIVRMYSRGG